MDASSAVATEPAIEPIGAARFRLGKLNGWFLASEAVIESRNPRKHLDWFLATVSPIVGKLRDLTEESRARIEVRIVLWSNSDGADLTLVPDDLAALNLLGVPVCLSFADYGENESEGS